MIFVIYGSETGNSEAISHEIFNIIKSKINETIELMTMNSFNEKLPSLVERKNDYFIVIMICSTTGNGDSPVNSEKFVRFIRKNTHGNTFLSNFYFATLGLGDSNYSKFQFIPKLIDKCFANLGAKRIMKRGEADDAYGLEEVVEPWKNTISSKISDTLKEIDKLKTLHIHDDSLCSDLPIEINPEGNKDCTNKERKDKREDKTNLFNARIVRKEILSGPDSLREITKITFAINEKMDLIERYTPGSYIKILPRNKESNVKLLSERISISDKEVSQNDLYYLVDKKPYFQRFLSKKEVLIEDIFYHIIDMNYIPKRDFLKQFASFVETKNKDYGLIIGVLSDEISDLQKNKITFVEIVSKCFKARLIFSIAEIFEFFPLLQPRSYSLISSSRQHDIYNLEIIFSLVKERVKRQFKNKDTQKIFGSECTYDGSCTSFLKTAKENQDNIIICGIEENLIFPTGESPFVYICNGTGLSPFLSYLKEVQLMLEKTECSSLKDDYISNVIVLTGVRSVSTDKNETIMEDYINKTIDLINSKFNKPKISYYRCVSQDESKIIITKKISMKKRVVSGEECALTFNMSRI